MIDLAEEIYKNLSLVTPNVYFSILPDGIDASVTQIVYELYESASYNLMHSNNFANNAELTIKILNPDALTLLRLGESVKNKLLSNPYEHSRDIKYNNSVPIIPDDELETLQLTLLFSVYYDSTVTPYVKPVVVERGVTTTLEAGAVYEVIHTPVTVTDRKGVVTELGDGESYTEAPVVPVTITDRKGATVTRGEGESYAEAAIDKPTVTIRGEIVELGEGENYNVVELPVTVTNLNTNESITVAAGEAYTVPLLETVGISITGIRKIKAGEKGTRVMDFDGEIIGFSISTTTAGNITFDVLKNGASICASTFPELVNQTHTKVLVKGWDSQLKTGDALTFNVTAADIHSCHFELLIKITE